MQTNFSWRNVLGATPPNVFWFFNTLEAIVAAYNVNEIVTGAPSWVLVSLLGGQVFLSKIVLFFGKIKDEYEQQRRTVVEVTSDTDSKVTVTKTTEPKD